MNNQILKKALIESTLFYILCEHDINLVSESSTTAIYKCGELQAVDSNVKGEGRGLKIIRGNVQKLGEINMMDKDHDKLSSKIKCKTKTVNQEVMKIRSIYES